MIVAVNGAPGAGKTCFTLRLAQELQRLTREPVTALFPDPDCPGAAQLFPAEEGFPSLGAALDSSDIFEERVLKYLHVEKSLPNLGFLGYRSDDTPESYPALTQDRVDALLRVINSMSSFIVADLGSFPPAELLGQTLWERAGRRVTVLSADFRSTAWLGRGRREPQELCVLNGRDRRAEAAEAEMRNFLTGSKLFELPYSRALAEQAAAGSLGRHLPEGRYAKALRAVAEELVHE